jgi:menaquinol-cytochrome c reductase cytochrome b/c subunit
VNRGQKEYYKRDYQAAKDAGKPFFPYAVVKDLLIATLAIGIVIALAIWQRLDVGEPVNPASTDFVPRPEWYFFFLFELLRIFKGENALTPVVMATVVIPTILMVLLILTPFIDRGPERRPQRRPIAIFTAVAAIVFLGYMTYKGAETPEGVAAGETLPLSGLDQDPMAQAGAELFLANGCTSCHMVAGVGATGPGPNLSNEGAKGNPPEFYEGFLKDPPGNVMPAFTTFTPEQYQQIGTFLSGLGTKYK